MHKTSAWPLALIHAALIVFASLFPFDGWRDQGIDPWIFLSAPLPPPYWTGFDVVTNLVGYAPLGFLLVLGLLRSGWRHVLWAVAVATLAGTLLSLCMEFLQIYLPRRVPSNLDLALNALGTLAGALSAALLERLGALDRWSDFRARWFVSDASGGMVLLALVLVVLGLGVGSTGLQGVWPLLQTLWAAAPGTESAQAAMAGQIVWEIRLPRTLGAWSAGALLGLAGAVAQGLFRNPLADPYLLGSAAGASLGVALLLALLGGAGGMLGASAGPLLRFSIHSSHWLVRLGLTGAAFVGAVLAVLLTLALARGVQHTLRLLLAGVIVGVVLGAIKDLITLASPDIIAAMQGFNLGSAGFIGWASCVLMLLAWCVCMAGAWVFSRALDGLSLGESTAASLGLPLVPMRVALVAVLALSTGTAVAQTGLIAFVGLAAPHLVRSMAKVTHAWLVLLASLMGGVLLMGADVLARWVIAPQELPVGVLTAVLGGGYLLWLMHRRTGQGGVL